MYFHLSYVCLVACLLHLSLCNFTSCNCIPDECPIVTHAYVHRQLIFSSAAPPLPPEYAAGRWVHTHTERCAGYGWCVVRGGRLLVCVRRYQSSD